MWETLLDHMIRRLLRTGNLTVEMASGRQIRFGDGTGDPITMRFLDDDVPRKIVLNPEVAVGEGYMDGTITLDDDDLYGLMRMVVRNMQVGNRAPSQAFRRGFRHALKLLEQYNPIGRAQANVAHHYDLSGELYDLFLDADKQYSCAYFRTPEDSLELAQQQKKAHIARKLRIEPGMRVLDIGCGWGGMGLTLARDFGAEVVGVTLSEEQHKVASDRARSEGLEDWVEFRLTDYRNVTETFDRIVSVGMFEHVGVPHYREYFRHVRRMLVPDGIALIHTIGRASPPGITSPWVTKYIFPGGYVPSMSEVMKAIEKEDLWTADVEVWRMHYAETIRHWHERFMANWDRARELYDERFCRMWRYYLVASEITFRENRQVVFQFQLTREQDAAPLTRDYLYPSEPPPVRHAAG